MDQQSGLSPCIFARYAQRSVAIATQAAVSSHLVTFELTLQDVEVGRPPTAFAISAAALVFGTIRVELSFGDEGISY